MFLVSEEIIATKLTLPVPRAHLIPRDRLLKQVEKDLWQANGFERRLTLVSAPAGYGKTTLIADWGSRLKFPDRFPERLQESGFYWLSLDEGDSDQVRFLLYFIEALRQADEHVGSASLEMLQSPQPPPMELLLGSLVNDVVKLPFPFVLVLDDYHLTDAPGSFDARRSTLATSTASSPRSNHGDPSG
jgi:LuxR family maltose regulon positive regulatory protein